MLGVLCEGTLKKKEGERAFGFALNCWGRGGEKELRDTSLGVVKRGKEGGWRRLIEEFHEQLRGGESRKMERFSGKKKKKFSYSVDRQFFFVKKKPGRQKKTQRKGPIDAHAGGAGGLKETRKEREPY